MSVQAQYPSNVLLPDWRNRMRQMLGGGGGENRAFFSPSFLGASALVEDLQPPQNASTPRGQLELFAAFPDSTLVQRQTLIANENEDELARNLHASRKRPREAEDLWSAHRHQYAPILVPDFNIHPQNQGGASGTLPHNQGGACGALPQSASLPQSSGVCTGLRLAFDDDQMNSSVTSTSGRTDTATLYSFLGQDFNSEMQQQREEIDHYIRLQGEHLKQALEEKRQKHIRSLLSAIEQGVTKRMREKDAQVEKINRRNSELEERVKQLGLEAHMWQSKAKCNEAMVTVLRNNLQQAEAQSREQSREGCGDSEADDAASSHLGESGDASVKIYRENKELKEQRTCRVCRSNDVCMLLLPCRHLCLCKDCEGRLGVCPLCRSMKSASVQVYMS